ncbi:DapH/DapD/GlmU-related protein [Rhodococcoides yunnanense]|uniref:DapH/DapD/GlmU-related protein n=1 Tax=Rhodococcoides yunnanense TaxID=278209 RepID=UPI0009330B82|nr:DapH/DapD/GlmU-related protein [Rhodococcus yunnanensis]
MGHTYGRQAFLVGVANWSLVPRVRRATVLQFAGVTFRGALLIGGNFVVQGLGYLHVGARCFINHSCYFDTVADISIGDGVFIADHVRILTSSHQTGPATQRASTLTAQSVSIGDGCWIGSGSVILPGVTIGAGTVIGANSLVTKDCEPDSVYVGSPAKLSGRLDA